MGMTQYSPSKELIRELRDEIKKCEKTHKKSKVFEECKHCIWVDCPCCRLKESEGEE